MSVIRKLFNLFEKEVGKEVYDVNFFNLSQDEGIDIMIPIFYSEEDAIEFARKELKGFVDEADLIEATVFAGEYEDEAGNVFGDSYDIYTISNKDKETTANIRKELGYVATEVNEYLK